jgi:predicted membrane protein
MRLLGLICIWIGVCVLVFNFPDLMFVAGIVTMLATGIYATAKLTSRNKNSVTIPLLEVLCVWIGVMVVLFQLSGILSFIGFCAIVLAGIAASGKLYQPKGKPPASADTSTAAPTGSA